ncbi:MAG: DNA translocase FtsK 4TM domain-containing protein [Parachlamydiales bacterium]
MGKKAAEGTPRSLTQELSGLGLIALGLFFLLGLISLKTGVIGDNWLGLIGYTIAWSLQYLFGLASYFLVAALFWWGTSLLVGKPPTRSRLKLGCLAVLLASLCLLLTLLATSFPTLGRYTYSLINTTSGRFHMGGVPTTYLYRDLPYVNLHHLLSTIGTLFLSLGLGLGAILVMTEVKITTLLAQLLAKLKKIRFPSLKPLFTRPKKPVAPPTPLRQVVLPPPPVAQPVPPPPPMAPPIPRPAPHIPKPPSAYSPPAFHLLTEGKKVDPAALKRELEQLAGILEETLTNFGIEAKVGDIHCGPTVISIEVHPAVGVKVQKIKALANDIALNMQAKSIRIIAPIPGKAAVGIEVPNPQPQAVHFKEMLTAYKKSGEHHALPLFLGKTVTGEPVISDLAKMPHMIIAGATGSGKSVCVNAIIMSLLMSCSPDQVRLLMVDPKKVELTGYSDLPHMIAPVITEPQEASTALNWLVSEMEMRYEVLKRLGIRNIQAFNSRQKNPHEEAEAGIPIPDKFPYFVGIIDELADLMMVSSTDIESPITRIAQMARAVGIHLILATQRPSREVITGLIKANFPSRIAFKVSSRVNSQIILDETGAENLLGNGDMLLLPPGTSHLVRAQGTYVPDSDIQKIVSDICRKGPPNYLIRSFQNRTEGGEATGDRDALYTEAKETVIHAGVASTTYLQRKLKVGYARAAAIMDQLERDGVIGPQDGAKPRQVLLKR